LVSEEDQQENDEAQYMSKNIELDTEMCLDVDQTRSKVPFLVKVYKYGNLVELWLIIIDLMSVEIVLEHEVPISEGMMKDIEKIYLCKSSEVYRQSC
jgi:hypothetical protein